MPETTAPAPTATQAGDGNQPPTFTIDVVKDLSSASALQTLLTNNQDTIFTIAAELAKYATQNISAAAKDNASASITLNADNSWTIPDPGITLSLKAAATGTISIGNSSETFAVTTKIDSSDTIKIAATPPSKTTVYVNIDLAFSIAGTAGAGGNINGVGIAGTVSDGHTATLTFCQPVEGDLNTFDALKQVFSQIVFPLDPAGIPNMQNGALVRAVFDGTFSAALNVTYGLGDHTFAAPSVVSALDSAQNVISITAPSLEIDGGVNGSITYSHTDHFALVVNKTAATIATVYLVRALGNDVGAGVGIKVGITTTNVSVTVNQAGLTGLVQQVTGNSTLAAAVATAAATPVNNLKSSLNAKLASWASDVSGEIGLTASLDRQTNRATLFVFEADLANASLSKQAWPALVSGDLAKALAAGGGLTLQTGSGVSESLKRSATINFQFFNLFAFTSIQSFFSNATAELAPDGTIRLRADIGDETDQNTKKSFSSFRVYFVVGATENPAGGITHTGVDLRIELSEAGKASNGASYVDTLSLVPAPAPAAVTAAQQALGKFLGGHPTNKVNLVFDIKSSAYGKLSFSPYTAGKPGALPHPEDEANWNAFHDACVNLPPKLAFVAPLNYANWVTFNQASIDRVGSTVDPDRHHSGNTTNGINSLPGGPLNPIANQLMNFYEASRKFMNLCEDISNLAGTAAATKDLPQYNDLLAFITSIVTNSDFTGYAVPTAGALLRQLSLGASFANVIDLPTDSSSITCTLTLS